MHARMYVYIPHIAFLSHLLLEKSSDSPEPEDILWEQINLDLDVLLFIIANQFGPPCQSQDPLQHGAYARAFLYILQDGPQVVARVILPAPRTSKSRQRMGASRSMRILLGVLVSSDPWLPSTSVDPITSYCSMPDNPVRAERVLIEYVSGQRLVDCWDEVGVPQETRLLCRAVECYHLSEGRSHDANSKGEGS